MGAEMTDEQMTDEETEILSAEGPGLPGDMVSQMPTNAARLLAAQDLLRLSVTRHLERSSAQAVAEDEVAMFLLNNNDWPQSERQNKPQLPIVEYRKYPINFTMLGQNGSRSVAVTGEGTSLRSKGYGVSTIGSSHASFTNSVPKKRPKSRSWPGVRRQRSQKCRNHC